MPIAAVHQIALVSIVVVIHHAALPCESTRVIVKERFVGGLLPLLDNQASIHFCDKAVTEMEAFLLKKFLFESSSFVWSKLRYRCRVDWITLHYSVELRSILSRRRLRF